MYCTAMVILTNPMYPLKSINVPLGDNVPQIWSPCSRQREREKDKQRKREKEKERVKEKEREREKKKEKEREKKSERERKRKKEKERKSEKERGANKYLTTSRKYSLFRNQQATFLVDDIFEI